MSAYSNQNHCDFVINYGQHNATVCGRKTEGIGYYRCFEHKNLHCLCGLGAAGSCGIDGCTEPICNGKHCYYATIHRMKKHI